MRDEVEIDLQNEIEQRFGVLPNFFRLTRDNPEVTANLWGFAKFAYLDSPLPSLFKERLFVYLSRFCEVRYCIARHIGFLVGLGYPAGDRTCLPQTIEQVLPLLQRSLPRGEELESAIALCDSFDPDRFEFPSPDTPEEATIFACATHVFLQTPDAVRAIAALRQGLGVTRLELLNVFFAFVRMAHYWTQIHPELRCEEDIDHLLMTHEALANCLLNDPEVKDSALNQQVLEELAELRQFKAEHESAIQAYEAVSRENDEQLSIERQKRQRVEEDLRESEEQLRSFVTASSDIVYKMSADWSEMRRLEGKDFLASTANPSGTWLKQYVPTEDQPQVMATIQAAIRTKSTFELEHRVIQQDGTVGWTFSRAIPLLNDQQEIVEWLGAASDITQRKQAELLLVEQKRLLELIAIGTSLDECLSAVCVSVSELNPQIRACFLLTDTQGLTFSQSITPGFPPSLERGVQGLPINDLCIGTCGEAVYRGQPITCANIANDDRWSQDWRSLCVAHGILACHSSPILGIERSPFGSLMLCFNEARVPTEWEYQLAEFGTQIASIAFERDRASLALRKSEQKYRSLFESIDQGFCLIEVLFDAADQPFNHRFLEVNAAFEQQSGLSNAVGKTVLELVPNLEPQWLEVAGRVAKSGESIRYEADVASMNCCFDTYMFLGGALGQNLVAVLFANITPRKRREANLAFLAEIQEDCTRLATADAMMQTIGAKIGAYLDLSVCAFIDIDEAQDQAIVTHCWHRSDVANLSGTYRISEFVSEEVYIASRIGAAIIVNDTNIDARTDAEKFAALNIQAFIHLPFLQDGQWKFLFDIYDSRPRAWREDEIELFSELANCIFPRLERARAEAALRESEELKQRILESSKDCIKVLTLSSEIVYINIGGLRLLEIDNPTFVLHTCWLDFWQGENYENAKTAIAAARAGNAGKFQGYLPTYKGTPKWWDVIITPVRNSAGQVTQLLVVSRDITKQKQSETEREQLLIQEQTAREAAENANRIKDEFLAVLSHELRSPLNPILGWSKLLQQQKMDAEKTAMALAAIERNAQLQVQLIDDLLDVSRILRGKLSLTILPVDLSTVISAALETVRLAAEAKAIQIQTVVSPGVGIVMGDAGRLQQVVWNLLSNAVKFTPHGGQVTGLCRKN